MSKEFETLNNPTLSAAPEVANLLDLSNRTVIVTGASGNIGAGISRRLAQAGANIVLHFKSNGPAAETLADELSQSGARVCLFQGDLSKDGVADRLIRHGSEKFGSIHAVVNNAAIQPVSVFADIPQADFDEMMRVNVSGPFALIKALAAHNSAQGLAGVAVNIASIEGLQPAIGHSHYASSKAALIMMGKAAALELGPMGFRVNSISPGLIHADGIEDAWPDGVNRWKTTAPLGRLGTPEDIGDAVLFLISDASRWISGANLVVDGGVMTCPTW